LIGIVGGVVIGLTEVMAQISFAALIFSGELTAYISHGIGFLLFGAGAMCLVVALLSSSPEMVSTSQDVPAAIFSVMGVAVLAAIPRNLESAFHTLVIAIIITSIVSGIVFMVMGRYRLGRLVRFIPFPVVGGFLAGTGWLLVIGAVGVMLGEFVTLADVPEMFHPHTLLMWLPGTVFGIVMLVCHRRIEHTLLFPGLIVGGCILFYGALLLTGTSIDAARSLGLLFQTMPRGGLWRPPSVSFLFDVQWSVLLSQAGSMAAIILISVISLLLNTTGIELIIKKDVNLDRELTAAGVGNIVAGLGGGVVGYHALTVSALGHNLGASTRIFGITISLVCFASMLFGASVLSYFPLPILGAILIYLGLDFLIEWVYDSWFKLSKTDYLLVILILVAIARFGFLVGVFAGLVVAVMLFVISYSKVEVVKYSLDGGSCRSPVDRSDSQQHCLDENAGRLCIMKLQGFIFFGTADSLLNRVSDRIGDRSGGSPRFVILDFRHVSGFDASAVKSFKKMKQLAEKQGVVIVFTDLTDWMYDQLSMGNVVTGTDDIITVFAEFNYALEWCEDRIIAAYGDDICIEDEHIESFLSRMILKAEQVGVFLEYLERVMYRPDDTVITQNSSADALYFIESGSLTVALETDGGRSVWLRTMRSGNVLGEVGMYQGLFGDAYRSASVKANEESVLYRLTRASLERMEHEHSELATALHRFITNLLSTRLMQTNRMVESLMN
jgi:SulP family sulfate permease